MNSTSASTTPTTKKRTVRRGRLPNTHYRVREYLTEKEVERLMKAAGDNRYGHRDATMILLSYRHGLRASDYAPCGGSKLTLPMVGCMCPAPKAAFPRSTPSRGQNSAPCAAYSASRSLGDTSS